MSTWAAADGTGVNRAPLPGKTEGSDSWWLNDSGYKLAPRNIYVGLMRTKAHWTPAMYFVWVIYLLVTILWDATIILTFRWGNWNQEG